MDIIYICWGIYIIIIFHKITVTYIQISIDDATWDDDVGNTAEINLVEGPDSTITVNYKTKIAHKKILAYDYSLKWENF